MAKAMKKNPVGRPPLTSKRKTAKKKTPPRSMAHNMAISAGMRKHYAKKKRAAKKAAKNQRGK